MEGGYGRGIPEVVSGRIQVHREEVGEEKTGWLSELTPCIKKVRSDKDLFHHQNVRSVNDGEAVEVASLIAGYDGESI